MRADRRTFLGALGASLLGSRLLDSRSAYAQTASARRLIIVYTPDGTEYDRWRPPGDGADFAILPGSILAPLAPLKSKLTVLDGLEYARGREHFRGMGLMLTNTELLPPARSVTDGASVDQYIAARIGHETPFPSLEFGVQCSVLGAIPEARMCFRRSGEKVPPNEDPFDVHRRVFGQAQQHAAQRLADRRSVIDLVRGETQALSARLSGEEKRKLQVHLDALRDVERGLESLGATCAFAPEIQSVPHLSNDLFPEVGRAQMDLMVAALACDLTRVASLQWSLAASPTVFSWLGHTESHHTLSHFEDLNSPEVAQFLAEERWYAEQFRYLIDRLDSLPEPSAPGSLLDHSIVLWVTEVGNRLTHMCQQMPLVMAGGGSGRLRPGRLLSLPGESHGKLLTSLCHAMGLDNRSFGDEDTGVGPLEGLLV